jgi:hypothetical protein
MSLNKNPDCTQGRWNKPWIEVKKSNLVKAGWGLFASRDFKKEQTAKVKMTPTPATFIDFRIEMARVASVLVTLHGLGPILLMTQPCQSLQDRVSML